MSIASAMSNRRVMFLGVLGKLVGVAALVVVSEVVCTDTSAFGTETTVSTIEVPISVSIPTVQAALEQKIPETETGAQDAKLGHPIEHSEFLWDLHRTPVTVTGDTDALSGATTISGKASIKADGNLIGGAVGKFLKKMNPSHFSATVPADVTADISVSARPELKPNWRLQPNLTATIALQEAVVPIGKIARVSIRGKLQPILDKRKEALLESLNTKFANDPFIEKAVRREWEKLCGAHLVNGIKGADGAAIPLWLNVKPTAVHASQPKISSTDITITAGIEATTTLTDAPPTTSPTCPPLPDLTPGSAATGFDLNVAAHLSYAGIASALTPVVVGKTLEIAPIGLSLKATSIDVTAEGDFVQIQIGFEGAATTGKIKLRAKPRLLSDAQTIAFDTISVEAESDDLLNTLHVATSIAEPAIIQWLSDVGRIDLKPFAERAKSQALEAVDKLNTIDRSGLQIERAAVSSITASEIKLGQDALDIEATAKGTISLRLVAIDHF